MKGITKATVKVTAAKSLMHKAIAMNNETCTRIAEINYPKMAGSTMVQLLRSWTNVGPSLHRKTDNLNFPHTPL